MVVLKQIRLAKPCVNCARGSFRRQSMCVVSFCDCYRVFNCGSRADGPVGIAASSTGHQVSSRRMMSDCVRPFRSIPIFSRCCRHLLRVSLGTRRTYSSIVVAKLQQSVRASFARAGVLPEAPPAQEQAAPHQDTPVSHQDAEAQAQSQAQASHHQPQGECVYLRVYVCVCRPWHDCPRARRSSYRLADTQNIDCTGSFPRTLNANTNSYTLLAENRKHHRQEVCSLAGVFDIPPPLSILWCKRMLCSSRSV